MQIIFNSDNRIDGHAGVASDVETLFGERLSRFSERLSRVEVHVANVEARPNNGKPVTVSATGRDVGAATREAVSKLVSALDTEFGKQRTY
jgi:hypothetical protein